MFSQPEAQRTFGVSVLSRNKEQDSSEIRSAIAGLYETHYDRVARYITVRIGDYHEAQDLASEVFVRALRSAGSYTDTGAPLEAWIFRIAHNIAVDHLRVKDRRPIQVPVEAMFSLSGDDDDPLKGLRQEEDAKRLHDALQYLTDAQRQVIALRFGSEMSSDQIAQIMGKKPGAVREMQSAAIRKLRQVLGDEA